MKIFEFKASESDWVFAKDIEEAKEFYLNFSGCGDLTCHEVIEVPESKWSQMYLLDPNESEPDDDEMSCEGLYPDGKTEDDYSCGLLIIESFKEYAENNTITDLIATTEY
jgi:hypothetical protein